MQSLVIKNYLELLDIAKLIPYVIDIGAADGLYNSNSYDLIIKHGWRATLFEPQEKQLNMARKLHENNVEYMPYAISEHEGWVILYAHPNDGDGNSTLNHGASLFHMLDAKGFYVVNSITYSKFIQMFDLNTVGLLALDTEGYDYYILAAIFQMTINRPQTIIVESEYYMRPKQKELINSLLLKEYTCIYDHIDSIFLRKDLDYIKL